MAKFGPKAIRRWTKRALRIPKRAGTAIAARLHPISRAAPAFNPLSTKMRMGNKATLSPGLWRAMVIGVPEEFWPDLNIAVPEFTKLFVSLQTNPKSVAEEIKRRKPDAIIVWGFSSNRIIQRLEVDHDIRLPLVHLYQSPLDDSRFETRGLSVDWSGSWVNSRRSSDLEDMLNYLPASAIQDELLWAEERIDAARAAQRAVAEGEQSILLIAQDSRDPVFRLSAVKPLSVMEMISRVSADFPGTAIKLWCTSPFEQADNIPAADQLPDHVSLIDPATPLQTLLQSAGRVCTLSSPLALHALMADIPVTVYGAPFYAGWGLTDDRVRTVRRAREISLEQLIATTGPVYSRWVDRQTDRLVTEPKFERAA